MTQCQKSTSGSYGTLVSMIFCPGLIKESNNNCYINTIVEVIKIYQNDSEFQYCFQ